MFELHWVAPDPNRERSVDPLGLAAQSDRIADQLLPGLSGQTRRARYLSFLCWAVREAKGQSNWRRAIHRLEAAHACEEVDRHGVEGTSECPGIVGRQSAWNHRARGGPWPHPAPEQLYKSQAWTTYRPLLRTLGLIEKGTSIRLTDEGTQLAVHHQKARGRRPRCLSELGHAERGYLKTKMGFDLRQSPASAAGRRRQATYAALQPLLAHGREPVDIIEGHTKLAKNHPEISLLLEQAHAWEVLSLALVVPFSILLHERRLTTAVSRLKRARKTALHAKLQAVDPAEDSAAGRAWAYCRKACKINFDTLGLDSEPGLLVNQLVDRGDVERFLCELVERHQRTKGSEAWIALKGNQIRVLQPRLNLDLRPEPRTYRLGALEQLLRDLELI